jgi:hypothetical protein
MLSEFTTLLVDFFLSMMLNYWHNYRILLPLFPTKDYLSYNFCILQLIGLKIRN